MLFVRIASIFGFLGVILAAIGAHQLKGKISDESFEIYRIGIQYIFFHIAPLLYIGYRSCRSKLLNFSGYGFALGVICFSGSNMLVMSQPIHHIDCSILKPITPTGGILLMISWLLILIDTFVSKVTQ